MAQEPRVRVKGPWGVDRTLGGSALGWTLLSHPAQGTDLQRAVAS